MDDFTLISIALLGTVAGSCIAQLPGLHVYNVAGGVLVASINTSLHGMPLAMLWIGLLVGWVISNTIPSIFLYAPDDANAFTVLPATRLLLRGQGFEAALLVGGGSLGALICLAVLAPALSDLLRPLHQIIQPHYGWMLAAIVAFLLLSEWPRNDDRSTAPHSRLLGAWGYLGAGLATFTLSGLLGFVLSYSSPIAVSAAYQNLLPAFVGLFAVPSLIQVVLYGVQPPRQNQTAFHPSARSLLQGTLSGLAGGAFAAFLPVISGGIGAMLSGAATAQRDDRLFLISQGASKVTYYAGSLLLLFVPGLGLVRGGMAWMLSSVYMPDGYHTYWLAIAAMAFGGVLAFGLLILFARIASALSERVPVRIIALCSLGVAASITLGFTGLAGLAVMAVATSVGLIPILIGGRRMNCLGILLVPMTLNLLGYGPSIASWMGLIGSLR